ncbi:universal stress protein [Arenibaculum pallidiluteum]|uniref:universal stress protein n=1 Tax=Arenibaculum pallidiluteum TaxID=2812559 RepID=UPI001A96270C|nr:universal stress protein [Arenibaculum pallidiluteum]
MSIKSILLHLANDDRHAQRLEVAQALARRHGAHLDILYIATPVSMPAAITGRGASYAFLAEATAIAHEKAEEIRERLMPLCADISHSWSVAEGDHVELLAKRAAYADLAVVSQSHPETVEDRISLHLTDRLPLVAPCPTLVIPWKARVPSVATHVLVGWKNTRETATALRGALPVLVAAERVTVLTIEDPEAPSEDGKDLIRYLGHHGVRAELRRNLADDVSSEDAGEIMLEVGREIGADALVMGCYGHSRLRELVLGGATRHVLGHMDMPVFMAH